MDDPPSQIHLDFSRSVHDVDVASLKQACADAFASILERSRHGEIGFLDIVENEQVRRTAKAVATHSMQGCDSLVVLGMGGSSLGTQMLVEALQAHVDVCVRFVDNSDPDTLNRVLASVDASKTVFNVVTKSGSTSETCAQLLVVAKMLEDTLGSEHAKQHLVVTTDPNRGPLRALVEQHELASLSVPPNIGGRFSVLSAVGLFPAAACGIDVDGLIAGARAMRQRVVGSDDLFVNPALMFAALARCHDEQCRRDITVMWPYADRLERLGAWFQQLWAESLGKRNGVGEAVGLTPLVARGASDQHSMLQLFADGPDDKWHVFVAPRLRPKRVLGDSFVGNGDGFDYLVGRDLGELIAAQQQGTMASLATRGRPVAALAIDEISPFAIGELLMLLMAATAFAGPLFGVNPFDQPGVEQAKQLAFAALGRDGYTDMALAPATTDPRYVF